METFEKIDIFPNATISEYGLYHKNITSIMMEIYTRGPVTAGIAGFYLKDYQGGIISNHSFKDVPPTHEISIIGWGTEQRTREKFWIIRNSWGEYWGEMSFARYVNFEKNVFKALYHTYHAYDHRFNLLVLYERVQLGYNILGIEDEISWATPGVYTTHNFPCFEDGANCDGIQSKSYSHGLYRDPSIEKVAYGRYLAYSTSSNNSTV